MSSNGSLLLYAAECLRSLHAEYGKLSDESLNRSLPAAARRLIELGTLAARAAESTEAEITLLKRADRYRVEIAEDSEYDGWRRLAREIWHIADGAIQEIRKNPPSWEHFGVLEDEHERMAMHRLHSRLKAGTVPPATLSTRFASLSFHLETVGLETTLERLLDLLNDRPVGAAPAANIADLRRLLLDGDLGVIEVVVAEIRRLEAGFDREYLRGSYFIRRCVLPSVDIEEYLETLVWEIGKGFVANIEAMAKAAENAADTPPEPASVGLKPGYLRPDQPDPGSANFYCGAFIRGTKRQLSEALFQAGIATSRKHEELDSLARDGIISIKGQDHGKDWRVWLQSKAEYDKAARHLSKGTAEADRDA